MRSTGRRPPLPEKIEKADKGINLMIKLLLTEIPANRIAAGDCFKNLYFENI